MFFRLSIILTTLFFFSTVSYADEIVARNLIISQGCKGCHVLEGSGGILGPELDKAGARLTRVQIWNKLLEPQATAPKSVMPDYRHLTDEQMNALLDFLIQKGNK